MVEVVRALAVLAVVFLNFAHAPLTSAAPLGDVFAPVDVASFCGSPADDPADHAPCHACRIGSGADLPPAPPVVACAPPVAAFEFAIADHTFVRDALVFRPGARAPPAF
jgi:hypothetical protein